MDVQKVRLSTRLEISVIDVSLSVFVDTGKHLVYEPFSSVDLFYMHSPVVDKMVFGEC